MAVNYGNKVFWAWNGKMEESEIRSQIRSFAEQKLAGFFIHSRCGLFTPYMSAEWFSAIQVAIEEAKAQGLEVWLYDEDGWPSGFAGGEVVSLDPSLAIQRMKCVCFLPRSAATDVAYTTDIEYSEERELPEGRTLVASFRKECGKYVACDITRADYAFVAERDTRYVDLLNPQTAKTFIACTHEKYKEHFGQYFGNTIRGIFTDEPQMDGQISYSPSLCAAYESTYHRSFSEDLKYLLSEDETDYSRFRLRYMLVLVRHFLRSYIGQLEEWCRSNQLYLCGHLPAEDGLLYQGEIAGSCSLAYAHMEYPGIDYLGRRMASDVLLKTLSGIKSIKGLPRVLSETFGCCGWDTTFGQYSWIWGYQAAAGINNACLHFSAYDITGNRKRDYPAFFSRQEPWFNQFHYLNDWMRSVNEFVSGQETGNKILVVSAFYAASAVREEKARKISNEYRMLVESLSDLQADFDLADELVLQEEGCVKDGRLCVGKNRYAYVIVPYMESLLKSTADLLLALKAQGGCVLYTISIPRVAEYEEYAPLQELNDRMRKLPFGGVVQNRTELWQKALQYIGYQNKFRCADLYAAGQAMKNLRMRVVSDGGDFKIFLMNKSASEQKTFFLVSDSEGSFSRKLFPEGEESVPCGGDGETFVRVELPPMSSQGYIFRKTERAKCPQYAGERKADVIAAALNGPNCLTVDRCSYSMDGAEYTLPGDVLHIQEEIFQFSRTIQQNKNIKLKYEIFSEIDTQAQIYAENRSVKRAFWNGKSTEFTEKYFLDKGIRAISSGDIRKGKNELVLEYVLEPSRIGFDPNQVFESERNRFSYEKEMEAIYVCGDFSLKSAGTLQKNLNCWRAKGDFRIARSVRLDFSGDLTPQGMYFYQGSFTKEFEFVCEKPFASLRMAGMQATCAEIFVNGKVCGSLFSEWDTLNITQYIHPGKNRVRAVYYSGLRNLLGPHHHYHGKVNFTGPNIFLGRKGWEDEIIDFSGRENTYTQDYSFVSFCAGEAIVSFFEA